MSLATKALTALAWVAPRAAVTRAHALGLMADARAYDGAKVGRRSESFQGAATSANVELAWALARLRNRSRDLARNTAAGARVLDVKTAHAIGTGIIAVPDNGSDRIDNQVRQEWADWCAQSDVEGILDFGGQQVASYRTMNEGGEAVIRRIPRRIGEGPRVPLQLQVLEGDFLDTARDLGIFDGHHSRLGVGLGDFDRRTGYWLHTQHPGDFNFYGSPFVSTFLPASEVIHLYRPLRPGQVRGVPVFAPVLMTARDLADLMDAVLVKAKTEACFAAFVKPDGQQPNSLGQVLREGESGRRKIEKLAPGMINYLNPGEEVAFAQPTGSGQFEPVSLAAKMDFAAGVGLTYDQLTGDLRQANYSSLRAGKVENRRLVEQEQELILVPQLMRRVTAWWTEAAILAGVLRSRREPYRWDFVMPAVEPIDPRKDLEADILAVRAGRMTPQRFISAWGEDWRKVVADTTAFFALLDAQPGNLVLDIDPRRTSQLGVAQSPGGEDGSAPQKAPAD
ncbi:phage portal protein [Methylobacterium sp. WSM2598]|uniref:phage portal protein n=1 Tax=Methylobacterium sp. WSM2598 TaxID=398261 RepID=UPI00037E0754|nr:phage portal protein [Methylobacterium sp. WSM2598]